MKKMGAFLLLLAIVVTLFASPGHAEDGYKYATTNMTFAEFYAGETGAASADLLSQGLDAISTPTTHGLARFPLLWGESGDSGTNITGLKAVQVRMTDEIYAALSNDSRYTFTDDEYTEYKDVNADGSFGAMVTDSTQAESAKVSFASGASATWGHYVLSVASADITIGSANRYCDYYLGALLETSDGNIYGMRHDNNLWSNTDIAFTVNDNYTEPHGFGTKRFPEYTKDIPGQTITKITYMLKGLPDVVIDGLNIYVKQLTSASVTPESSSVKSGSNIAVKFTFSDVPDGATYTASSAYSGSGRGRQAVTDFTYSDGAVTFANLSAGSYTVIFSSEQYADISASFTVTDYYATTDMTFAEFYAGETGETASTLLADGLDAISTPTTHGLARFPLLLGESGDNGTTITGLKAVQVRMTGDVYNALTDKSRYTFTDESFTEYKLANSDGSFGAMVTETTNATSADVTIATGSSARWGHYVLSVSGASIDIGSANRYCDYYLGALIETSDGKIYGMRHDNNLWSNTDIAFTLNANYTEPHGVGTQRFYEYTSDLEGKTINKITYMLKGIPDVVIDSLDLYIKKQTSASVKPESDYTPGANVPMRLIFSDIPDGVTYELVGVSSGTGRNSRAISDYTYENGILTITGNVTPGTYTATFRTEEYVDISATITVTDYFATTDMTWAEFYAGEIGETASALKSAGLDAVSSPTARIATRFPQLTSESNDIGGRDITGVKAVRVSMTQNVYNVLSNDSRYTFSDEIFTQYKPVSSDGSFGAMVAESKDISGASVALSSGASSTWGSYMLTITSLDLTISSGDENYYLGALAETSDGQIYGLRHNTNLWFNAGNIAFTVNGNYTEPHGVTRDYAYTSDLEGKTITKITYLLKDQPKAVLPCNVYLKPMSEASVSVSATVNAGVNVPVSFTFDGLPDGTTYTLTSLYSGTGRGRTAITDYTYENGTLTVNGRLPAGTYSAIFSTDDYADIGITFTVEDTYHYATTDMTWAEFYAGELGETSSDLYTAGLDAISSPTARVANRFTQLTSESNDIGGRDITGVSAVQVRMNEAVYALLSGDTRYTFSDDYSFAEYKTVSPDGTFGAMVTETHTQEGATVSLTAPGTWGDYVLAVNSIDITLGSGDTRYYLGAIVETSDGSKYGMRHNNNLWFNAKDLAISTAEFVEVHGVSRNYAYTSDMEGKTITKITYMLKNLPDEIISCDVFLKLKTSASVEPVYESGYHAVMAGVDLPVKLSFDGVPSSADYQLSAVYYGTGRGRSAVEGCTMSGDVLTIAGTTHEGTYTATFSDETYANITATIRVYTTNATDKIISADKNKAGLMFLLTPAGVSDATDAVLDAQNFVNATDYTDIADNMTDNFTGAANMIQDSGFTLSVQLDEFPAGKHGILGFSKNLQITPAKIGDNDFSAMVSKILALPDVAYGWRIATPEQLKDMGLTVTAVYPDGVSRDVTGYISSGLYVGEGAITFSYGTVLVDREFTPSEEGKVYALSDEGEGTMSDGAFDGKITATWYVSLPGGRSSGDDTRPTPASDDTRPTPASDDTRPAPTSDDTRPTPTPGGNTPSTTAPTTAPSKPAITLTDSKKSDIVQALGRLSSKVTATTEITELPASAIKSTRNAASSDNTIYISDIEVSADKVYVFGVSLDKFAVGAPIYWNSNATDITTGEFVSAVDSEEAVIFMNDSGEEVTTVPANKHVNVAAYLEAGKTYSPTITTTQSSGNNNTNIIGSSGGGCEAFGSMIAAMLAGLLMIAYRKQR